MTVFFDGGGAPSGTPAAASTPEMEVLYSRRGKTADEMIERAAHRFSAYGEVLVVTDDQAERETVIEPGRKRLQLRQLHTGSRERPRGSRR